MRISQRAESEPSFPADQPFLDLIARAKQGDASAIEQLCERFYPAVEKRVHGELEHDIRRNRPWLSTRFSTGDVVHDVFRGVLSDLDAFGGNNERAFIGYLTMLVHNRLIDAVRYHQADRRDGRIPSLQVEDAGLEVGDGDPQREAMHREDVDRFREALASLTTRERLLIRARTEDGCSFEELAERLGFGCSATARRSFYAAQAALLERLDGE